MRVTGVGDGAIVAPAAPSTRCGQSPKRGSHAPSHPERRRGRFAARGRARGGSAQAKCGKICECQKACYATYEKFIFGNPKPGEVAKHRKQYFECKKGCG